MHKKAEEYINRLQLSPHPEGGYYKEIYRAGEIYQAEHLPGRYTKSRVFSTSIYFMLEGSQVSNLHRLKSDEIWHFYDGSGVIIYGIAEDGRITEILLGNNIDNGELPQAVIREGTWFCAEVADKSSYSLIGCTVSPGFEFEDFELGEREKLLKQFPAHEKIIKKFTKFTS